jgi:ABC-type maltose transport system permease subunit
MLDGVMLLWFILTAISVVFVATDIRKTPESKVLKWGFILLTLYTGPFGAFLYVLGCREPLAGLHERFVAVRWRQVLGSTMHCVAGDGVGILVGAVIGSVLSLAMLADIALEYVLGFGFGWTIFQALFMKDTAGGSYLRALHNTFIPELLSMNCLMAAMVPVAAIAKANVPGSESPLSAAFWFIMSMALLAGFIAAYPMNWWLVSNHLKHGMMTVRPKKNNADQGKEDGGHEMDMGQGVPGHGGMASSPVSTFKILQMTVLSFAVLAVGIGIALAFNG